MNGPIFNAPALNLHTLEAYPFADWASRTDQTGTFRLPDDFLVGLYFSVPLGGTADPTRFYVNSVATTPVGYQLTLAYDTGSGPAPAGQAIVLRQGHTPYKAYPLTGIGDFADCTGSVVVAFLSSIDQQPAGLFLFDRTGTQLQLDCVRPALRGVRSIAVQRNGVTGTPHFGDVVFQQGAGLRLTTTLSGTTLYIRPDVIQGDGMVSDCPCSDPTAAAATPIVTINGQPAGPDANVQIATNSCFQLVPTPGGLLLQDNCTQPCCGCSETRDLQADRLAFETARKTMQEFLDRMNERIGQIENVLMASRLSTAPCA